MVLSQALLLVPSSYPTSNDLFKGCYLLIEGILRKIQEK